MNNYYIYGSALFLYNKDNDGVDAAGILEEGQLKKGGKP